MMEDYLRRVRQRDDLNPNIHEPSSIWFITKKYDGEAKECIVNQYAYDNYNLAFHVLTTLRDEAPDNQYELVELSVLSGDVK